jgi:hypothetical protein
LVFERVHTLVGGFTCKTCQTLSDYLYPPYTTYQKWHPWPQASCDLHGAHAHGR